MTTCVCNFAAYCVAPLQSLEPVLDSFDTHQIRSKHLASFDRDHRETRFRQSASQCFFPKTASLKSRLNHLIQEMWHRQLENFMKSYDDSDYSRSQRVLWCHQSFVGCFKTIITGGSGKYRLPLFFNATFGAISPQYRGNLKQPTRQRLSPRAAFQTIEMHFFSNQTLRSNPYSSTLGWRSIP